MVDVLVVSTGSQHHQPMKCLGISLSPGLAQEQDQCGKFIRSLGKAALSLQLDNSEDNLLGLVQT